MKSIFSVAVVFGLLAVVSVRGDGPTQAPAHKPNVNCYTCDSCPDPFNVTQQTTAVLKPCPSGITSCFKYFHTDKRVQRGCSPVQDQCPDDSGKKFNLAYCYTCYHDKCNSATRLLQVSALPLISASVASLLGLAVFKRA